jgi:hypothetical protein
LWVLWGQKVFDNATEAAASISSLTEVPALLQASVLLAHIVVERGKADWDVNEAYLVYPAGLGGTGGGGVPITNWTSLTDTPGSFTGAARAVSVVNDAETAIEHQPRMRFMPYVPGSTYYPQEVVYHNTWQMVCNNITTDYPAPEPLGPPTYALPDVPVFSPFSDDSVVVSGHLYSFLQSGYFRSLRVWAPDVSPTVTYRIIIIRNPNSTIPTTTVINDAALTAGEWTTLGASVVLVGAGEELAVVLESTNSGTSAEWAYNWERGTSSNNEGGFPTSGLWNSNSGESILRINWLDAELIPGIHQIELQVVPNTLFEVSEVGDVARFTHYSTTGPYIEDLVNEYTRYPVIQVTSGAGGARVGEPCQIRAVQPIAQATEFVGIDAHWGPGTLPSWAGIQSALEFDGVPQAVQGDEAYGVDILYQPIGKSDDWDIFGFNG